MSECKHGDKTAHGGPCPWCKCKELEQQLAELLWEVTYYREIKNGSRGVVGWHLNGHVAEWEEFDLP